MTTTTLPGATDATAAAAPSSSSDPAKARRRRVRRSIVAAVLLLALLALTAVLPEPRTTQDPLAPDSTADDGSRAVAQILGRQGVRVHHESRLRDAVSRAAPGTTLLVTSHDLLDEEHTERLAATGADLVLLRPSYLVGSYAPQIMHVPSWGSPLDTFPAACTDPDAVEAGVLAWSDGGLATTDPSAVQCFGDDDGAFGMVSVVADGRRVVALATDVPFMNAHLEEDGNAALALRLLGRHRDLVWYTPESADLRDIEAARSTGLGDLVPGWVGPVAAQLLVLVVFVAVWRGRRLGPLVTEPLPVVVRSAETTRGRGRLYRRARSYGHAAAALRAASASRCASRLGLPRSAGAEAVIDAVALASGRPADDVARLFYGPPPTSDTGLTDLARELDRLESEVHRP